MKIFYKITAIVLLGWVGLILNSNVSLATTLEEKQQIASKVFQAPGAKWEVFEQPFWKHSVIFHLTSGPDPVNGDYRRPFVAVDQGNKGYVLTDNTLMNTSAISNFDSKASQEVIKITKDNVEEYARFFARVYGIPNCEVQDIIPFFKSRLTRVTEQKDREDLQKLIEEEANCQKEGLHFSTIIPMGDGFLVNYFWRYGGYSVKSYVVIHRNGTIVHPVDKWEPRENNP